MNTNRRRANGSGKIKIIAGAWKGRKLPIANLPAIRPTPDRVKETLFNWLTAAMPAARTLDCFSGTGALSFEALSRGAQYAVMLEQSSLAVQLLNHHLALLSTHSTGNATDRIASRGVVICTDSLAWLAQPTTTPFDIIFLDPPFQQPHLLYKACQLIAANGFSSDNTLLYTESERTLPLTALLSSWCCLKNKTAGQVRYCLWGKIERSGR